MLLLLVQLACYIHSQFKFIQLTTLRWLRNRANLMGMNRLAPYLTPTEFAYFMQFADKDKDGALSLLEYEDISQVFLKLSHLVYNCVCVRTRTECKME